LPQRLALRGLESFLPLFPALKRWPKGRAPPPGLLVRDGAEQECISAQVLKTDAGSGADEVQDAKN